MSSQPVRPELVAAKLRSARQLEDSQFADAIEKEPRWVELLWFLQWFSFQPGGLVKLAKDLVSAFPERVLTEAMKTAGAPGADGKWSLEQALLTWGHEWKFEDRIIFERRVKLSRHEYAQIPERHKPGTEHNFVDWIGLFFDPELTVDRVNKGIECDKAEILRGLRRFNYAYFERECRAICEDRLPSYLHDLCSQPHYNAAPGPSWFPDVAEVLFDYMALHAERKKAELAETQVSKIVFDAFDYAWEKKKLVRITGNTRFGKSESVRAYCAMYPGRFRRVEVPGGDAESDLIRVLADSIGMEIPFGRLRTEKRQQAEDILRHGSIGIALDECHYLFPCNITPNCSPSRLIWVRSHIIDRQLPCVLIATPQAYETQERRFRNRTGYNMEQFGGRFDLDKELPNTLSQGDLMAIARHHCPNASQVVLEVLVGAAMAAPSYVGTINRLTSRAMWFSERRGAREIGSEDIIQAIAEVPELAAYSGQIAVASSRGAGSVTTAKPSRQPRKSTAELAQELRPGGARIDLGVNRINSGGSEVPILVPILEPV